MRRDFKDVVRTGFLYVLLASWVGAQTGTNPTRSISAEEQAALDRVSAASLRGHLSFIASDLLEGRSSPSRGLDIAALYIASQFRRAGLEPAGDDGYFQTANWFVSQPDMASFEMKLTNDKETFAVGANQVTINIEGGVAIDHVNVVKVDFTDVAATAALTAERIQNKAVLTEIPDFRREPRERRSEVFRAQTEFTGKMAALKPAIVISVDRNSERGAGPGSGRLIDPENRRPPQVSMGAPIVTVHDPRIVRLHDKAKVGETQLSVSLKIPAAVETPVKLRNVIGVLPGSDPVLKDTYVLVTAHYDHLGMRPEQSGDNIFNGANDDGSGTVSVVELALALGAMKARPRRTLVFMTFFGEEKGLLGSRFYGRHPVFPIEKTVADINLEQVGRTDSTEGPQVANASMTGFDFSDVGQIFKTAGELTGITVYKHERNSDAYFGRSDNQALADQGVPAHTLCTAFDYPDYHGVSDHWEKIDYDNMARVDRMVALGLLMIANSSNAPAWNSSNPKAARYLEAWRDHHPSASNSNQK